MMRDAPYSPLILRGLLFTSIVLFTAAHGLASSLVPAAYAQTTAYAGSAHTTASGLPSQTSVLNDSCGSADAFSEGMPEFADSATASLCPGLNSYTAYSELSYYFELFAPETKPVSVIISGALTASGEVDSLFGFLSAASLTIGTSSAASSVYDANACASSDPALCTSMGDSDNEGQIFDFSTSLSTNVLYTVVENADAYTDFGSGGAGDANASADPSIVIDPSFGSAGDVSLVFSDGITNTVSTPEPTSFALFGGALAVSAWLFGFRRSSTER